MKNLQKKITEFLPASSTKKSVQNFFLFCRKNLSVLNFPVYIENRIFSLFLLMVGLSPDITDSKASSVIFFRLCFKVLTPKPL
jgi:hypothetical protein